MDEPLALLTVEQLSALIHKSPASIRSDSIRNPKSLPPVLRIPGSRRLLFCDYNRWIKSLQQESTQVTDNSSSIVATMPFKLRRGRPTKIEQLARAGRSESNQPK
jgi:hypothetical protein